MTVTEPPKTSYLHVREAEAILFPFAIEIIGNAKALLQLRKQIDRALEGIDGFPFDETIYRELDGDEYEVVVRRARSREEMRVSMHDLPGVVLGAEDRRDSQGEGHDLVPLADLAPAPLYPHDVGQPRGAEPGHGLEAGDLALPDVGCGALHRPSDLFPPACGRGFWRSSPRGGGR